MIKKVDIGWAQMCILTYSIPRLQLSWEKIFQSDSEVMVGRRYVWWKLERGHWFLCSPGAGRHPKKQLSCKGRARALPCVVQDWGTGHVEPLGTEGVTPASTLILNFWCPPLQGSKFLLRRAQSSKSGLGYRSPWHKCWVSHYFFVLIICWNSNILGILNIIKINFAPYNITARTFKSIHLWPTLCFRWTVLLWDKNTN